MRKDSSILKGKIDKKKKKGGITDKHKKILGVIYYLCTFMWAILGIIFDWEFKGLQIVILSGGASVAYMMNSTSTTKIKFETDELKELNDLFKGDEHEAPVIEPKFYFKIEQGDAPMEKSIKSGDSSSHKNYKEANAPKNSSPDMLRTEGSSGENINDPFEIENKKSTLNDIV